MRQYAFLSLCALSWLSTAPAQAFSDWTTFRAPAAVGGGGERYFTGVPTDGYTCEVCHSSKTRAPIEVTGLPIEGYEPGTPYFVEVRWPAGMPPAAMVAEVIAASGVSYAPLSAPLGLSASPEERCASEDAKLAVGLIEDTERNIIRVDPCGSAVARFALTTPDEPALYFSLSAVVPDGSETPEGDAVFDYQVRLHRVGEPGGAAEGCSVRHTWTGGAWSAAIALVLLAWSRRRSAC